MARILDASNYLPSAFDRASLDDAIKDMSAQQKCIMITSIVSMNDEVNCGFDFRWVEGNLNAITLLNYRESPTSRDSVLKAHRR